MLSAGLGPLVAGRGRGPVGARQARPGVPALVQPFLRNSGVIGLIPDSPDPDQTIMAGRCATCKHARQVSSARSRFLRCELSDRDPAFPRYPRLPVLRCEGWETALASAPRSEVGPAPGSE